MFQMNQYCQLICLITTLASTHLILTACQSKSRVNRVRHFYGTRISAEWWRSKEGNILDSKITTLVLDSIAYAQLTSKLQGNFDVLGLEKNVLPTKRIDFSKSSEGSNLITRAFFGKSLRILFALFVYRRFCLHCLYVAIAHMMPFYYFFCFYFSVVCSLGDERTIFWKKEKILIAAKSRLVGIKGYLERYNRMKYISWNFLNVTSFTPNF